MQCRRFAASEFIAKGLTLGLMIAAASACKSKEQAVERGAPPPPIASSKPGACASGGGTISDVVSAPYLPKMAGDFCVDPNGDVRAYGESAKGTLDQVCTELFDGECEVYKRYGLRRVVTLRYIDGKGSPATVNVNLSRFGSPEGAYGFFTKRIIADADPLTAAPSALDAGGVGALGTGIAYVWRSDMVAELSYTNEIEPPDQLKASSQRILPEIAKALGEKLPGEKQLPESARLLPAQDRIPMGVSYTNKDILDVSGAGPGALGFYKTGETRYRAFVLVRPDEDSAKDVIKTFKKLPGAKGLKDVGIEALGFTLRESENTPAVGWVVTQKGARIFGVGDEAFALGGDAKQASQVRLPDPQKVEKLKALLQSAESTK